MADYERQSDALVFLFIFQRGIRERYGVELTPLSYVPGGSVQNYLGNLNFFFIRESTSIRESGGVSGFVHSFITEVSRLADECCMCNGFHVEIVANRRCWRWCAPT